MSKISFGNVLELVEARIAIETDIVELATKKSTPEDLNVLSGIMDSMKNAPTSEIHQKFDVEFHLCLAKLARNSFLYETLKILNGTITWWIGKVAQIDSASQLATEQHECIVNAVLKRDSIEAVSAMRAHLTSVSDLLIASHKKEKNQIE